MRKFLAALLAVMMLVAIAVPVAAADEPTITSDFDGTDAKYATSDYSPLVVTEIVNNSNNSLSWSGDVKAPHYDAFTYIEVYNRSDVPIELTDVAIVSYKNTRTIDDAGKVTHEFFTGTFEKKYPINAGSIWTGTGTSGSGACANPSSVQLQPGQIGVIWVWNSDTITVDSKDPVVLGSHVDNGPTFQYFRQHYSMDASTPIVALYMDEKISQSTQCIYGLVRDQEVVGGNTENTFQIATPIFNVRYDGEGNATYTYPANNNNLLSLFEWGGSTGAGLGSAGDVTATDDQGRSQWHSSPRENKATIYVPANTSPDYYNYKMKAENDEFVAKRDYVDIDGTYVFSYREMAIFAGNEVPTPGKMPAIQWAYLDPDKAPADIKATATADKTWQQVALDSFITANPVIVEEDGGNRTETAINITFKDRSELGNKGQNQAQQNVQQSKSIPWWIWLIIGLGAAAVIGGAAVVVIIVLKKKKAVASDDVAAEGEIMVIDETNAEVAVEDAPVEAADENAPTEE